MRSSLQQLYASGINWLKQVAGISGQGSMAQLGVDLFRPSSLLM